MFAYAEVFTKRSWIEFAGVQRVLSTSHESIAQIADCEPAFLAWRPSSVEIVPLIEIFLQSAVRIVPRTKVKDLAPDLFAPPFRRVRRKRVVGIRLRRFLRLALAGAS